MFVVVLQNRPILFLGWSKEVLIQVSLIYSNVGQEATLEYIIREINVPIHHNAYYFEYLVKIFILSKLVQL